MDLKLKDKVVVVTGGAGLLGREFCRALAAEDAIAVIADLDEKAGPALQSELSGQGKKAVFIKCDITDKSSVQALISILDKRYGRIDALVNNAYPRNRNYGRKFEEVEYRDFCQNVDLHLGGYFLMSQQVIAYMVKQKFGNIISLASIYGVVAPRFEIYQDTSLTLPVEYAVIKSGLVHLTKYLARYLNGKNIRVNSLSPGGIFDDQPDPFIKAYSALCLNQGMLKTNDLNGTLLFLLSDHSKLINGQNIIVDDGFVL